MVIIIIISVYNHSNLVDTTAQPSFFEVCMRSSSFHIQNFARLPKIRCICTTKLLGVLNVYITCTSSVMIHAYIGYVCIIMCTSLSSSSIECQRVTPKLRKVHQ